MDNKEKMKIILPFIILAICVPIIVDFFIFGNSFPSNISNESWAGFFGEFFRFNYRRWMYVLGCN